MIILSLNTIQNLYGQFFNLLSIQSLTEIFNEFYDKFYFVRNTEVDRFNRSRFVPMIAKNIQLNYKGFNIEEITAQIRYLYQQIKILKSNEKKAIKAQSDKSPS